MLCVRESVYVCYYAQKIQLLFVNIYLNTQTFTSLPLRIHFSSCVFFQFFLPFFGNIFFRFAAGFLTIPHIFSLFILLCSDQRLFCRCRKVTYSRGKKINNQLGGFHFIQQQNIDGRKKNLLTIFKDEFNCAIEHHSVQHTLTYKNIDDVLQTLSTSIVPC